MKAMTMTEIPEAVRDLLERPLFVHLATTRPDGAPQVNPMWFVWDGEFIWFTHTSARQKYRNITHEPRVAISIIDPDQPYRYTEVRGVVDHIEADPEAKMYQRLSERYEGVARIPGDAPDRVAIAVRPTWVFG
jgi:PPOX class probable F420-dependent enzyme